MSGTRSKTVDRQAVLKKLFPLLKKHYKIVIPPDHQTVLDTMLMAVCQENVSLETAQQAFRKIREVYPDLNEIRVSSITELEMLFVGMPEPDWRAFRLKNILQYIFERSFEYEFESLRKKTIELAVKQLAKIKQLSYFIRSVTLQSALGAHLLPLDDVMCQSLRWLGLATADQSNEQIAETLKTTVRKAEASWFCVAIRCLATDQKLQSHFEDLSHEPIEAIHILTDLLEHGGKRHLPEKKSAKVTEKPVPAPTGKAAGKVTPAAKKSEPKKTSAVAQKSQKKASKTTVAKPAKSQTKGSSAKSKTTAAKASTTPKTKSAKPKSKK